MVFSNCRFKKTTNKQTNEKNSHIYKKESWIFKNSALVKFQLSVENYSWFPNLSSVYIRAKYSEFMIHVTKNRKRYGMHLY